MFIKKGIIYKPSNVNWVKSHLWVPTAYKLNNEKIIIYFAGRNKKNESDIGYFIYDIKKNKVTNFSNGPILKRGSLGSFDDSAVIPSHIIKVKKIYYLYYIGWTQGKKIPYIPSIGLAYSKSLKSKFKKYSKSPILDKNYNDQYFIASCFVRKIKKNFIMDYTSNLSWKKIRSGTFPRYLIKTCRSKDGFNWQTNKNITVPFQNNKEVAITRPWILKSKRKYFMFTSIKKKNYKIKILKSNDGFKWNRMDKKIFSEKNKTKFDSVSQEYASLIKMKDKLYMFYNGNDYGKNGICLAISNTNFLA